MRRALVVCAAVLLASSCSIEGSQSVLDPAGAQSASIHRLWMYMLVVAAIVYAAVMITLAIVVRGRRGQDEATVEEEAGVRRVVVGATATTLGVLLVTLILDFTIGRHIMHGEPANVLTVELTGHQWWWEVEYADTVAQNRVMLANEIHLPVGRVVRISLISHDVIHSFWVPNLGGKKDLIPGHDNELWLRPEREGVYRAQCAEFCGLQHANMALFVVVESPGKFDAWMAQQRLPAPTPDDSLLARGRDVVERGSCAVCHAVRGTSAAGRVGPDLTHVASRLSLAAGTLRNSRATLAGWIADPQSIKPGAQMPPQSLGAADLRAVLAYLETLR